MNSSKDENMSNFNAFKIIVTSLFAGCLMGVLAFCLQVLNDERRLSNFHNCVEKLDTPNKVETCIAVTHPAAPQPTVKKENP